MARFLVLERPLSVGGEGISDMWAGVCSALTRPGAERPLRVHNPLRADGGQTEEPRGAGQPAT